MIDVTAQLQCNDDVVCASSTSLPAKTGSFSQETPRWQFLVATGPGRDVHMLNATAPSMRQLVRAALPASISIHEPEKHSQVWLLQEGQDREQWQMVTGPTSLALALSRFKTAQSHRIFVYVCHRLNPGPSPAQVFPRALLCFQLRDRIGDASLACACASDMLSASNQSRVTTDMPGQRFSTCSVPTCD